MADGKVRVGVVGLGSFGSHHARHYAAHPAAELVAVVDVDAARAEAAARTYGAESLSSHENLIGKVDAVSVTAPASEHHAIAVDLVEAGIHVFVEKPIAVEVAAAADLVRRAERGKVILQVGHIERYSPAFRALQERVSQPRRIACVRRTPWTGRSTDVDVVLDLMIHDIDLILSLSRTPITSVEATGEVGRSGTIDEAEAWLTFANGLIATFSASRSASAPERKLTITEPTRVFVADLAAPSLSVASRRSGAAVESVSLAQADNLGAEIAGFLHSALTGKAPLVDGRAGVEALFVADMIRSAIAAPATARSA